MTLKIEVTVPEEHIHGDGASKYLASALSAIGYSRHVSDERAIGKAPELAMPYAKSTMDIIQEHLDAPGEIAAAPASVLDEPSVQAAVAKRERGKPSPGRARRTKEEIAEDDEAERVAAIYAAGGGVTDQNSANKELAIVEGHDPRPAISTGEERVDPAAAAQDAADEAAETASSDGAPTLNDLRRLMGDVQRKHGMATATRIPFLLGKPIAEITDAELPEAIAKVQTLLDGDTPAAAQAVTTATVAAGAEQAPVATKEDLIAAMLEYADFADGTREQAKMKWTMVDVPVVFDKLFGVQKLSEVPASGYGLAVAGIREMLAKDPFNRKRG